MNEIEFKFMPEMHLRQAGFAYSACGPSIQKAYKKLKKRRLMTYLSKRTR